MDDIIGIYLKEARHSLLDAKQEKALALVIEQGGMVGEQARQVLIESNLGLVINIANNYYPIPPLEYLDLVQEGNLGLLETVKRFKVKLGFRFSTYATWWIKRFILNVLSEGKLIRIPRYLPKNICRYEQVRGDLLIELGKEPTIEEIAAAMGIKVKALNLVIKATARMISFETPYLEKGGKTIGEVLLAPEDEEDDGPAPYLIVAGVRKAIQKLPNRRHREILRMRFGIGCRRRSTLRIIGAKFSLSKERIRQLERAAMDSLRDYILAQSWQQ